MPINDENLREPMTMPDPLFPIKVHKTRHNRVGAIMFSHHWHEHLEFLYFVSGTARIECGSSPMTVEAGDLVVVNSNELHYGRSASTDVFYYALIMDTSLLHSSVSDASVTKFITPLQQNRLLLRNLIRGDADVAACILAIIRELDGKPFGYELAVKSELYRLLVLLLRGHIASVLSSDEHAARLKKMERFQPVLRHIDAHYDEPLPVEALASMAGLSRYHFSRLFKELTGRTISEYITAIRLDKADYLLQHTALTISEIAGATGFSDIFYFSRTFRKHKKMTPSQRRESQSFGL